MQEIWKVLEETIQRYGLTSEGSFAFGDTEHDLPMLEAVENPVALNPNDMLRKEAEKEDGKYLHQKMVLLKK